MIAEDVPPTLSISIILNESPYPTILYCHEVVEQIRKSLGRERKGELASRSFSRGKAG